MPSCDITQCELTDATIMENHRKQRFSTLLYTASRIKMVLISSLTLESGLISVRYGLDMGRLKVSLQSAKGIPV